MEILVSPEEEVDVLNKKSNSIVIYNDDINTFAHVINCLTKYCHHDSIQAEQCTLIIHNKGRCAVKDGSYEDLKEIKQTLCEKGIDAKIE